METPILEYTNQSILTALQDTVLLPIMGNPRDLRRVIVAMERSLELLRELERSLYPEQVPMPGRSRRNYRSLSQVTASDAELLQARVLRVIAKLTEQQGRSPTRREIRQRIKGPSGLISLDVLTPMLDQLVIDGKLHIAIRSRGARSYGLNVPTLSQETETEKAEVAPCEPAVRFHLEGRNVGVHFVVRQCTSDLKVEALVVNRSKSFARFRVPDECVALEDRDLVFLKGSKEYNTLDRWIHQDDNEMYYDLSGDPLILPDQF